MTEELPAAGDVPPASAPAAIADELLAAPLHGLRQAEKNARLTDALVALTRHHRSGCAAYRRITDVLAGGERPWARLADLPWLPVGLFTSHELRSLPREQIVEVVESGSRPGSGGVYLDRATADRATVALTRVVRALLGSTPLPVMLIESAALPAREPGGARASGLRTLTALASASRYVLDGEGQLDRQAVVDFLADHGDGPFAIIGHTANVWGALCPALDDGTIDLSRGIVLHSGGRRRPAVQVVDNATLRARLQAAGITRVHNVYGLAEQPGAVLIEGEDGLLYPPAWADVIIRDPMTFDELPTGKAGVVQMVSALATSYPGHSLLTEDLGVIERVDIDVCGRLGKAVRIIGRAPRHLARGAGAPFPAEVEP